MNFLAALLISALMWLGMVFIGYTIGLSVKNTRKANSIPQLLGFFLGFLPTVYYPLSLLPSFLQPVARLEETLMPLPANWSDLHRRRTEIAVEVEGLWWRLG